MKSLLILAFLFSWISRISRISWVTQNLKIEIQLNNIFPLTLAYSAWTQGSLQFVEITNIGANEQKYFHIM